MIKTLDIAAGRGNYRVYLESDGVPDNESLVSSEDLKGAFFSSAGSLEDGQAAVIGFEPDHLRDAEEFAAKCRQNTKKFRAVEGPQLII